MKKFDFNFTYIAIQSALLMFSSGVVADTNSGEATLDEISVKAKAEAYRQQNEVTGLGKITKNIQDLNKQQVLNIRDLTRYDPGISVVEQGRGATNGYSIRGVDRNRVALIVDGLPQIQSYKSQSLNAKSGAINEIEYENIRAIEFSKGASSSEYGSGALGGAVGFRTKNASDVIKEGQNWGLDSKTAYVSKNHQLMESLSFAGRSGGLEGLIQYTHRQGKETDIHKDATNITQSFFRVVPDDFNLDKKASHNWFVLKENCPTGKGDSAGCVPRPTSQGAKVIKDSTKAQDYTGDGRIAPDPMKYRSGSWLVKLGYQFSPNHSVNTVFEHTKQRYSIQDMTVPKYGSLLYNGKGQLDKKKTEVEYSLFGRSYYDKDPSEAIGYGDWSTFWSKSSFYDEWHTKRRLGMEYQYKSLNDKAIFDRITANLDQQNIRILTDWKSLRCSPYPTVDKNCKVTADKRDSRASTERNIYKEQHKQAKLTFEKDLSIGNTLHLLNLSMSYDRMRSNHKRDNYGSDYIYYTKDAKSLDETTAYRDVGSDKIGTYQSPLIVEKNFARVKHDNFCKEYGIDGGRNKGVTDCSAHIVKGQHYSIGLSDRIFFGDKVDLGFGGRYDYHRFKSDDHWTSAGSFKNFSWSTGLTLRPIQPVALSYRISSGFRVPSFDEMFGYRIPGAEDSKYWDEDHRRADFAPEKALNQEVGIAFNGDFGSLEVSYFDDRYKDLITFAKRKGLDGQSGFYNLHAIKLTGINVVGKLNWNGIWSALPEGLYSNLAYNRINVKNVSTKPGYVFVTNPLLDSIQPARYIASLGYDEPNGKWGINNIFTYSKGKNANELVGTRFHYSGDIPQSATVQRTKSWYTFDMIGYYQLAKHFTLRAGVYNLMNRKYNTWEAVRQSSVNSVVRIQNRGHSSYAAPGRNYVLSLEAKF